LRFTEVDHPMAAVVDQRLWAKDEMDGGGAICVGIDFGAISSKMRLSDHAARSIA
jgi:hypothetical protein